MGQWHAAERVRPGSARSCQPLLIKQFPVMRWGWMLFHWHEVYLATLFIIYLEVCGSKLALHSRKVPLLAPGFLVFLPPSKTMQANHVCVSRCRSTKKRCTRFGFTAGRFHDHILSYKQISKVSPGSQSVHLSEQFTRTISETVRTPGGWDRCITLPIIHATAIRADKDVRGRSLDEGRGATIDGPMEEERCLSSESEMCFWHSKGRTVSRFHRARFIDLTLPLRSA